MVKKVRRVRTFARTASKSMEKNLINNAKKLKNNPFLILPDYNDNHSEKIFRKLNKGLKKIEANQNDQNKLEKLSNKKGLDGAVAGTILIAISEKAPYLGVARLPLGDITYAQRGRADKFKLIAAQHFNNPILRLFGVRDIALKRKLYIYSWENGFFSSGIKPKPPEDFIDFIIKKIGFSNIKKLQTCSHLNKHDIKEKKVLNFPYIRIYWKSTDITIGFCNKCVKNSNNTLFNITKYIIAHDLSEDFSVDVIAKYVGRDESVKFKEIQYFEEYLSGKISDADLIKKNISKHEESLKESGEKLYIIDDKSFGSDTDLFIRALKPNKFEIEGLKYILNKINEPLVLKNVTPNKLLEMYWHKYGLEFINSIINNKEMSENFLNLEETPSNILELVYNFKQRQDILSKLPSYRTLPPLAKFADNLVKLYKTYGKNKTLIELKNIPNNTKQKSLAYSFLLVFNKGMENKWKFSKIEIESGEFLKTYAIKLLESKPNEYHISLNNLLKACGSSENIDNYKI
jgi:hypothetical protein